MPYNTQVTTPITTEIIEAVRRSDGDFAEGFDGFLVTEVYGNTVNAIFVKYDVTPLDYVLDLTRRGVDGNWVEAEGIVDALSVMDQPVWSLTGELGEAVNTLKAGSTRGSYQ